MKYKTIDQAIQGEYLAKPIYGSDGRVLLEENVLLTIGLLARLRRMGITALFIRNEKVEGNIATDEESIITEETKREAISILSTSYQYIQSGKTDFQLKSVSKVASSIIDEIMQNKDVLVHLNDIRTSDNHLFLHSISVCIFSVLVGLKLGLDRAKLRDLAIGALFHDIGKIIPDSEVVNEKEKDHTWKGFNLLRKNHETSMRSAVVAFQHHEHLDGSGYPRGIKEDEIHLFSKIVAVANQYDSLVNGDEYIFPYEACERIMALTNIHFDHEVVWNFLRSVAFYPNGSHVKLTTGETGIVVSQNRGLPQRPIIKIIKSSYQMEDFDVKEIDLAKETTVFIKKIIA